VGPSCWLVSPRNSFPPPPPPPPHPRLLFLTLTLSEPWLHLTLGVVGGYLGLRLAAIYDDTNKVLTRQYAAYASLPSWAHAQLDRDELSAELRGRRLAEFDAKFKALEILEEKEALESQARQRSLA
jgi:hypothetical protein